MALCDTIEVSFLCHFFKDRVKKRKSQRMVGLMTRVLLQVLEINYLLIMVVVYMLACNLHGACVFQDCCLDLD